MKRSLHEFMPGQLRPWAPEVMHPTSDKPLVMGHDDFLLTAQFTRQGSDLLLEGGVDYPGHSVLIPGYFSLATPPDLVTGYDARVTSDLALRLAGPATPAVYAENAPATPTATVASGVDGVGHIESTVAGATVTRAGVKMAAEKGMVIQVGDVIETPKGGGVGLVYADNTTISLANSGRLVVEEMKFDPAKNEGKSTTNVVQGEFSFVSGHVAKTGTDKMVFKTPVAVIGVRGTTVAGKASAEGSENSFTLLPDADGGVGKIAITNQSGTIVLSQPNQTTTVTSFSVKPTPPVILSHQEVQARYGSATRILPPPPATPPQGTKSGSTPGKEGDAKGDAKGEAKGDGKDAKGDGKDVKGDGKDAKGDGKDVKGDGKDVKGDGKDAKGDGKDAQGDGKDVKGDGKDVKGDGKDVKGDGKDVKGDGKDVKGDGKDVKGDGKAGGDKALQGDAAPLKEGKAADEGKPVASGDAAKGAAAQGPGGVQSADAAKSAGPSTGPDAGPNAQGVVASGPQGQSGSGVQQPVAQTGVVQGNAQPVVVNTPVPQSFQSVVPTVNNLFAPSTLLGTTANATVNNQIGNNLVGNNLVGNNQIGNNAVGNNTVVNNAVGNNPVQQNQAMAAGNMTSQTNAGMGVATVNNPIPVTTVKTVSPVVTTTQTPVQQVQTQPQQQQTNNQQVSQPTTSNPGVTQNPGTNGSIQT
ncbi:MAG: FecR domain-containing protein, partial [Magnetococcales bacterium]|nr:FecR domain-containing protein [Magnetococcales bacterium]